MNEVCYVIWSEEHGAWWRSHANGYTRSLIQAGRYPKERAQEIVAAANEHLPAGGFHEIMVEDPMK